MLSGETSTGRYPVNFEGLLCSRGASNGARRGFCAGRNPGRRAQKTVAPRSCSPTRAEPWLIVVYPTRHDDATLPTAAPRAPIFAFTPSARGLSPARALLGVVPVRLDFTGDPMRHRRREEYLQKIGSLQENDNLIVISDISHKGRQVDACSTQSRAR